MKKKLHLFSAPCILILVFLQVRRIILSILCVSQKISPQDSRISKFYHGSKSEENSSETNQAHEQAMHQRCSVRTTTEEISSRKTSQEIFWHRRFYYCIFVVLFLLCHVSDDLIRVIFNVNLCFQNKFFFKLFEFQTGV